MKYVSSLQCSYSRRQRKDAIRVVKALANHNLAVLESCMELSKAFSVFTARKTLVLLHLTTRSCTEKEQPCAWWDMEGSAQAQAVAQEVPATRCQFIRYCLLVFALIRI